MFIACESCVSYGVLPSVPLHLVMEDIGDKGHPILLLARYNEGSLYF
jgi:hypothetical protein